MITKDKLETERLGFHILIDVVIDDDLQQNVGNYETIEHPITHLVPEGAPHTITIKGQLQNPVLIITHECYHLFYAIRHLIKCEEEIECEVFGDLCQNIYDIYQGHNNDLQRP